MMLRKCLLMTLSIIIAGQIQVQAKTTISWWQFWTDPGIRPTIDSIVEEFEQSHPDIEVRLSDLTWSNGHEKIVLAFSSGAGPDIVELGSDWIPEFADAGKLLDISVNIKDDSAQFQGWGMATYHDKVYGFPWILGTRILFANRSLFIQAGLDSSFVPYNWETLKRGAFAVDTLGKDIYGWGSNVPEKHRLYKKFLPFFWSAGAKFFTDDKKYSVVSSMYAINALRLYKMLHDSSGFVGTQRQIEDAFLDGRIGTIISGDWLLKRIRRENRSIDLIATSIPGPKYPGKSFLGGEFLAINARSKNKEAALEFVRFITAPKQQLRFCKANMTANPSSREAQDDPFFMEDKYLAAFGIQIRSALHPPVDPDWVYIESIFEKAVEDALFGSRLPASALREAQLKITELRNK